VILALRVVVLAWLVAACATPPTHPVQPPAELPGTWLAQGRLAVTADEEAWHGTFAWHQAPAQVLIEMAGPLGQGSVRLREDHTGALLEVGADQVFHGRDTEALLREQLGWSLPVRGLRYWITGRPDPDRPAIVRRDEAGRVISLEQDGWDVACTRYLDVGAGVLPHRLVLEREALRIRLVIDRWQPGPLAREGS